MYIQTKFKSIRNEYDINFQTTDIRRVKVYLSAADSSHTTQDSLLTIVKKVKLSNEEEKEKQIELNWPKDQVVNKNVFYNKKVDKEVHPLNDYCNVALAVA